MIQEHSLNIGILFHGPFPWNRGIGQLYNMLQELGHKPFVFAAYPEKRYQFKAIEGYRIFHFRNTDSTPKKIITFHLPVNLFWEFWLMKMCRRLNVNFLAVRETPLSFIAQRVAHRLKIPVVLDMRENLPEIYAESRTNKIPLPSSLQSSIATFFESFVVPRYDHIFTVTDELKILVNNKYGVSTKKISVLGNYPDKIYLKASSKRRIRQSTKENSTLRLVFSGEVSENRGIQDIVTALSFIPAELRPNFTIIGEGSYLNSIRADVKRLRLNRWIEFFPLLPPEELPGMLSQFDVGVCPYQLNEQTHNTMPGKLFEYMAAGLAVISSARKPVKRVLEKSRCGLIYNSNNPVVIASVIRELDRNRVQLKEMGMRGRDAIFEYYNFETNLDVLKSVFASFKIN